MKIYTRTGDEGDTGLFGGPRVRKSDPRVEAYGTVDELNAHLGWAVSRLGDLPLADQVEAIQRDLLVLGADLATPPDANASATAKAPRIFDDRVAWLEETIDRLEEETAPLTRFILPGGDPAAAAFHVSRTVCRRAERRLVALAAGGNVTPAAPVYVNRLSDLLFVMARWVNARRGVEEPTWDGTAESQA